MIRFDANLTFLFRERPLPERFAAARAVGFSGVELLVTEGAPPDTLACAARKAGVEVVLCNAPMGDFLAGGLGLSGAPGREREFAGAIKEAAALAATLSCLRIHVGPSRLEAGASRAAALAVLRENLRIAAEILGEVGVEALVEPLNTNDVPDVLLYDLDECAAIIGDIGAENLKLQFDVYHMSQMQPSIVSAFSRHIERIGHVQFADAPGRGAPGSGEIDFPAFFETVEKSDYQGWLGAEFNPGENPAPFAWLERYQ